ncbi:GNAT family N-acetyltransferase [Spongiimicrobium sp. 2-473A-2-J]|uniref:GNAT family N-acetyltransferase n=1 Tax=Eudoraea algarum TaxID=3417568 RepID=UPI003D36548E
MVTFKKATSDQEFEIGKGLFRAYAEELGIDLTFQNFEDELQDIARQYSEPEGSLVIAYSNKKQPIGCFGIRKLDEGICELKRMYIHPEFRGQGIGNLLMKESIRAGNKLGYTKIRLDTLSTMRPAIGLYKSYGFYEIEPYRYNPMEGAMYFERALT